MIDPVEFGKAMGALIKEATAPLLKEIDGLKMQLAGIKISEPEKVDLEALAKSAAALIEKPQDGTSVSMEDDVLPVLKMLVHDAVEALPKPEPEKVDIEALAKSAAALIEKPQDGKNADMEVVKEHIESMIKALPTPQNGKDADMPALKEHLTELVKGVQPAAPLPAPTVEEVAATFERRFSDLTLSWERQARDTFEKAADRMPKPKDGRDAIPLDGFDLSLAEDGRTVIVKMQAGETVIEKSVKIAAVIDKGTYKHEGQYEKGDGTSYGGSFWIAKCDNPQGVPGTGETDWRCAVKAGRPGKDLRDNASKIDPTKGVSIR